MPTGANATSSRVTVPIADIPPGTLAGLTVRDARFLTGFRISVEDSVVPANAAVIVTGVGTATGLVNTSKLPIVPATITLAGTVASVGSLLNSSTAESTSGGAFR